MVAGLESGGWLHHQPCSMEHADGRLTHISVRLLQPKQVTEIKDFLLVARRKDAKCTSKSAFMELMSLTHQMSGCAAVVIKKNKDSTKFKVRCSKYLYTIVINDKEKANKLKQTLPEGAFFVLLCTLAICLSSPTCPCCSPEEDRDLNSRHLASLLLWSEDTPP